MFDNKLLVSITLLVVLATSLFTDIPVTAQELQPARTQTVAPSTSATSQQDVLYNVLTSAERQAGWKLLFDGKSLDGWKASDASGTYVVRNGELIVRLLERTPDGKERSTFRVENGELIVHGLSSHLYYFGPIENHDFKNFELTLEVKTYHRSNSGVFFHTAWRESGGAPETGIEVQVNNTHSDPSRTGGLWSIKDNPIAPVSDGEWFTLHLRMEGKRIITKVNGKVIVDFTEESNPQRTRVLSHGTFAIQGHDPRSEVHYRNIKVRPLPMIDGILTK